MTWFKELVFRKGRVKVLGCDYNSIDKDLEKDGRRPSGWDQESDGESDAKMACVALRGPAILLSLRAVGPYGYTYG